MKNCLFIFLVTTLVACNKKDKTDYLFTYTPATHSQITFSNTIKENDSINVIDFQYCYNGGGVGIGDFNNDNLPDIIFTGNQVSSRLYLNKGNMVFDDITEIAGINTTSWVTGVSIVDINNDGHDDIYLSVGGANCQNDCTNLLFINQGLNKNDIPFFKEEAQQYGLDDGYYSQQTIFFDYDNDEDLDVFIVRNGNTKRSKNNPIPKNKFPEYLRDKLLENVGLNENNHPYFKDVTHEKGITEKGFGLGVTLTDFNKDNLPDIYITNDFITNDVLYINQGVEGDYAFAKAEENIIPTQTYNAMGVDIADINNDLLPDIAVVDMLPSDYIRQKKMLGFNNYDKFLLSQKNEYTPQYVQNTLQLHNGILNGMPLPTSEVAHISSIAMSDWSWSPLLADYDNDGKKDLYVTNGYVKDITDLDFINYSSQNNVFGTQKSREKKLKGYVDALPGIYLPNIMYRNLGNAVFEDISNQWMHPTNSFSNGAAYADLDLDGDLDIIINNINTSASILENHTDQRETHYLRIQLRGISENKHAIGAQVTIWENGIPQMQYQSPVRGYLSSMEPILHFGVHKQTIDSLSIIWPDGKTSTKKNIAANTTETISYKDSQNRKDTISHQQTVLTLKKEIVPYLHKENNANDFAQQSLLPNQFNANGPVLIAGNIDTNPGDEIFIGGNRDIPSYLFYEDDQGMYNIEQTFVESSDVTAALFIDIDNDNDLDLYVGYGGTDAQSLQDKILLNDNGVYRPSPTPLLPNFDTNTQKIIPIDYDSDGDIDLFIAGGVQAGNYPRGMESFLLENKNQTYHIATKIQQNGFLKDATVVHMNNTEQQTLITVGHWTGINAYTIHDGNMEPTAITFKNIDEEILSMNGWWNTIEATDIDNDGDMDLLLGNQGTNGFIKPVFNKPLYVYNKDFDSNGSIDPVLAQYFTTKNTTALMPIHTRDDIIKQIVGLKKRYGTYDAFAKADFKTLLNIKDLDKETLNATIFESVYAENIGNNTFVIHPLPAECQYAPINDFLAKDIDSDGFKDILIVGNDYTSEANYGRHDALIGAYLKGSKQGFEVIKSTKSGFLVPKQSNHITTVRTKEGQSLIMATQNNHEACIFVQNHSAKTLNE